MKRFGKYLLERQLAIGGMAEVFLARQHGPAGFEKTLVIKRILPHFANDEQFISMFLDEARTSAKLNHPNLVQIYELGEIEGSYYIAMEYIRGESLSKVLRRLRQLEVHMPLHLASKIIASVCAGLDYAHNFRSSDGELLNLVHRDISPDNVLVSYDGAVKMIDFGIAKARENETKTQAGSVKGKFCYMSPEQVTGKRLDRRSDIFSLGIVLHELTTLTKPFGDGADLMTVSAIVNDEPRQAAELVEGYPEPLWGIIDKALTKDRDQRFQNAHEMQIALERFVHSRGEFLSDRDIGAYLRKLFSEKDQDLEDLREMASGIKSRVFVPTTGDIEQTLVEEGISDAEASASTVIAGAAEPAPRDTSANAPTVAVAQPSDEEIEAHTRPAPAAAADPAPKSGGTALKWVLLVLGIAALGAGGWFGYQHYVAGSGDPPPAVVSNDAVETGGTDGTEGGQEPGTGDEAGTGGADPEGTDGSAVVADTPDAGAAEPEDAGPTEPEDAGEPEPEDAGEPEPEDAGAVMALLPDGAEAPSEGDEDAGETVEDAGTEEPIEDAGTEEPVEDAGTEEPVEDAGAEEPVEDAGAEEPVEDAGAEEPAEDAGAAGAEDATLTVRSKIEVWVRVGSEVVGQTPVSKTLPAGKHVVYVKGPGIRQTFRVDLEPGEQRVIDVQPPPPPVKKGTIVLRVPAAMKVTIDGRAVPAGRRQVKVPYGSHKVVITDPKNPSRRASKTVDVNAARPTVTISF